MSKENVSKTYKSCNNRKKVLINYRFEEGEFETRAANKYKV